jgi:predicted ester cyclase
MNWLERRIQRQTELAQGIDADLVRDNQRQYKLAIGLLSFAVLYPGGPEGFKIFRRQVNAAIPDEHLFFNALRFEGDDIIEVDLTISATHTGEQFMDISATGRKNRFDVRARGRFVDGKMAERWDQADFADVKRQLTEPTH